MLLSRPRSRSHDRLIRGLIPIGIIATALIAPLHAADRPKNESASLSLLIVTVAGTSDDGVRGALLKGILKGLEGRRNVQAPEAWPELKTQLESSQDASLKDAANRLSQIFGDREAGERALVILGDSAAAIEDRRSALASLLAQKHPGLESKLASLLEVKDLRRETVRAYGVLGAENAPELLLERLGSADAETRRTIIETLSTRKAFAKALTRAIRDDKVQRDEIPSYVARSLRDMLGKEFTAAYGSIPELNQNVNQLIAKYKKIVTDDSLATADAAHGRVVFQKTCGACHLMYGIGGKIGPALTGSNRANLDYLLLNSIAPSADVPEGYRTQLIQTVDGRILTGVLAEEDGSKLVLKTVDQPRLVIAKEDIEARRVSDKSMMPEGQLDQLAKRDLLDLVKYMQTKTQVDLPE